MDQQETSQALETLRQHFAKAVALGDQSLEVTSSTADLVKASVEGYLAGLEQQKALLQPQVTGIWTRTGYRLSKTGQGFFFMRDPSVPKACSERVYNRRIGPHRPRRLARTFMARQLDQLAVHFQYTPIPAQHFYEITVQVEKADPTSKAEADV